jgi:hypothetical protein
MATERKQWSPYDAEPFNTTERTIKAVQREAYLAAHAAPEVKNVLASLIEMIPFVEDEWEGTKGCLMCSSPMNDHAVECPIGRAKVSVTAYQAKWSQEQSQTADFAALGPECQPPLEDWEE